MTMFPERTARHARGLSGRLLLSLRLRLIVLVGLILLASRASGSALLGCHAANSVPVELRATLKVGTQSVHNGFNDIVQDNNRAADLRRLIATFIGNRHVRATGLDADGRPLARSQPLAPSQRSPRWFRRRIGGDLPETRLPVPPSIATGSTILLRAIPSNEEGDVWGEARDSISILTIPALRSKQSSA